MNRVDECARIEVDAVVSRAAGYSHSSKAGACHSSFHPPEALTCAKEMSPLHGSQDAPPKYSSIATSFVDTTVVGWVTRTICIGLRAVIHDGGVCVSVRDSGEDCGRSVGVWRCRMPERRKDREVADCGRGFTPFCVTVLCARAWGQPTVACPRGHLPSKMTTKMASNGGQPHTCRAISWRERQKATLLSGIVVAAAPFTRRDGRSRGYNRRLAF